MATDLYRELGVSRSASQDDIKKAYRKLAAKYHPDRNPDDQAAEARFKAVNQAHQVLGDVDKRKLYDEFGEISLREGFDANAARSYGRARNMGGRGGGFSFEDILGGAASGGGGGGFGDLFGEMFGGRASRRPSQGNHLNTEVSVDLASAIAGTQVAVPLVNGSELNVRIPPGAGHGDKVRVAGQGAPGLNGGPPGDLLITVHVRQHPCFERKGLDLELDLPLTVGEAFHGAKVPVPTPHGEVSLKVPPGTQSGQVTRLRGKGVARQGKTGDLYVRFLVRLPELGSKRVASAVDELEMAMKAERSVRHNVKL